MRFAPSRVSIDFLARTRFSAHSVMLRTTVTRVILLLTLALSWVPGVAGATVTLSIPDDLCAEPGATDIDVPILMENDVGVRGVTFTLRDTPDDLFFDNANDVFDEHFVAKPQANEQAVSV